MREGPVPFGTYPPLPVGARVGSTDDEQSRNAANAVVSELSSRGFDATLVPYAGLPSIHPTPTRVIIFVDHKPEGAQGEYKLGQTKASAQVANH
jgi:hypothetical protein